MNKTKTAILDKLSVIAPQWARSLRQQNGNLILRIPKEGLDMQMHSYCIVGEAHGFSMARYKTCVRCWDYSDNTVPVVYPDGLVPDGSPASDHTHEQGWTALKEFIKHFNKEHNKK